MPFEEVPKRAMKQHKVLLFKGQAFVPSFFLDDIIQWHYQRKLRALPAATAPKDSRMRSLIRLWDRLVPTSALASSIDMKQLVKPDCISATLEEYPGVDNRKFLSNYLARLGVPIESVFKPLAAAIERKYPSGAKQKQAQVERELKQWYGKSKDADYHSCEQLLMKGKCPFFEYGKRPLDAIAQCWGNLQVQGKKTPMEFTRAHAKL